MFMCVWCWMSITFVMGCVGTSSSDVHPHFDLSMKCWHLYCVSARAACVATIVGVPPSPVCGCRCVEIGTPHPHMYVGVNRCLCAYFVFTTSLCPCFTLNVPYLGNHPLRETTVAGPKLKISPCQAACCFVDVVEHLAHDHVRLVVMAYFMRERV